MNDDNRVIVVEAGTATAYGSAVEGGYTGTYEDFCRQQAGYAENAAAVEQAKTDAINAKNDAVTAKNTAVSAKDDAVSAKDTAVAKASEASTSATNASQSATSASQSAQNAEQSAQSVSASVQQIATNTADISQLKADLANLDIEFTAEKHWFVAGRYLKADDTFATGNQYGYSLAGIFSFSTGLVKVSSKNNIFDFSVVDRDAHTLTAWQSVHTLSSGNYTVNLRKKDGTAISATDIDDIVIYVRGFDFYEHTHKKVDVTQKLNAFKDIASNRKLISSGDKEGLGEYTTAKYNALKFGLYSDKDIELYVGRSDTFVLDVFVDGSCVASIEQGNKYTISAGTVFVLGWHNTASGVPNGSNVFIVVSAADVFIGEGLGISQYYAAPTFSPTPDVGCSFAVGNKIFSISDSGKYCVTEGHNTLVQGVALDVSAGHANSCNYDSNSEKVYVSDWDIPSTIHVYSVDAENNSISHDKDIIIPVDSEVGVTEYFVYNNEQQIISLGWKTGNSSTNPNVLVYALWLLTTDGYVKSWERYALRPTVLQSMIVQDKYIYYINCYGSSNQYKTIGINRINMETGMTEYTTRSIAGGLLNLEAEGLIPIGNQVFLVVTNNGQVYLVAWI